VAADEFCAADGAANTRVTTATSSVRNRRDFTSGLDDRRGISVRPKPSGIDHIVKPSLLVGRAARLGGQDGGKPETKRSGGFFFQRTLLKEHS
jgi:hypothetical protein